MLDGLLADQAVAKEEQCSAHALACVNVTGEVAVIVADEPCGARHLGEVQTEVKGASHISENALDSQFMLHHRPLHEPTNKLNDERQVWASVHQIAQTADELLVVHGVDLLRRALSAKPQSFLHRSMGRVVANHTTELQNTLGVVCLTEGDAVGILAHLDAEVEAEEAEVTHVEDLLHL